MQSKVFASSIQHVGDSDGNIIAYVPSISVFDHRTTAMKHYVTRNLGLFVWPMSPMYLGENVSRCADENAAKAAAYHVALGHADMMNSMTTHCLDVGNYVSADDWGAI